MRDGERAAQQYDALGSAYDAANSVNWHNAHYERPAMLAIIGNVGGLDVLECGCGPGRLSELLADQGAGVTAIDASSEMVRLASERLGERATVFRADLEQPLSFAAEASFDLVVASLVLHYLRDWEPVLHELRRVMKPTGRVVLSVHHPAMDWQAYSPDDYFAFKHVTETWDGVPVTFWRRPLSAMTEAFTDSGFVITRLLEPRPADAARALDPDSLRTLMTRPNFLFFELRPDRPPPT